MERKKFTTTLDKGLLDAIKVQAAKENRRINAILEELMRVYLQYINSRRA